MDLLTPLLADPPDVSVIGDEPAWLNVKRNAGDYGVLAIVANAVRPHVSLQERAWCDRILTQSWAHHEGMLRQLDFVIAALGERRIPAISLKGPLLAQRYYEPPYLRKSATDLDIAVAENNLAAACDALIRIGYELEFPIAEVLAVSHHVTLRHSFRPRVELHFRLSHQKQGIRVEEFFERVEHRFLPSGLEVMVLGAADQLLHLILHLGHSRFGTLFNLYEVRRAFRAEPPDVRTEAIARAVGHHFCGTLRMTEIAMRTRFGEPFLPSDIPVPATWLNWRIDERLYYGFERWSVQHGDLTPGARLWGRWLEFQLTDRPVEAIRSLTLLAGTARFQLRVRKGSCSQNSGNRVG